ncbi:MAG: NYN domain-containing protein [Planctomycetes bacterium]|nr:NYN domain-containing protein [Planctomycetota bacterium]
MYVVDGYNLLHALSRHYGALPADDDRARARLIELLAHIGKRESKPVRIFFDGTTPANISAGDHAHDGVTIKFCGADLESADRAICEYVENSHTPRKITVVSSDRAIASVSKLAGAKNMTSQKMAEKLANNEAKENTATALEKPQVGYTGSGVERQMLEELADFDLEEIERRMRGE